MKRAKSKEITSFDGAKIHYEVSKFKSKHCLIFLHGLGGDLTSWNKERDYFIDKDISTIAVDLRGHGYSGRSDTKEFYSMVNFARDILEIMKEEKFERYSLIGHCFGGMVSLILEGNYPKSSKNLVLVDTSYKPPFLIESIRDNQFMQFMLTTIISLIPNVGTPGHTNFDEFIGTKDIDLKRIAEDILHTSLRSYLLICENLLGYNATKLLGDIVIPTLVIEGTNDSIFPPDVARSLKSRIKSSQLDLIPNANHIIVINNPLDLAIDVDTFLTKNRF